MELDEASCSSVVDLPESFRIPQNTTAPIHGLDFFSEPNFEKAEPRRTLQHSRTFSKSYIRRRRIYDNPMPENCINQIIKDLDYEGSIKTSASQFKKREMTTIHEEDFHYRNARAKFGHKMKSSKSCCRTELKAYKEKVASLKVIISRLQKTFLAQPEALQNHIPDETIQLFQKIHI